MSIFQISLCTVLFFIVLFTIPIFFLLHTPTSISLCSNVVNNSSSWTGDLREAEFAWNRLDFSESEPPPLSLKIAVFTRKWPLNTIPGGMERHAHTLHTALAQRGHRVHVYTSPPDWGTGKDGETGPNTMPRVHWHEGEPGKWKYRKAWEQFEEENQHESFDVVHSESVALPHWLARDVPNLAKLLDEIRFFKSYTHHIAISDSCGEMLRDVYQIPNNASFVFGVAGRLVRDKGHPLLYEAFPRLIQKYPNVYLVVAGSGPWAGRYKELGRQVLVLGSMSPSELRAFYNSVDIFLNPTLRPQGLDLTLMEAMMIGTPIMASRFPSIKGSIIVKEELGFMFSPNVESLVETMDAVVNKGSAKLLQMGKACREYATSMFRYLVRSLQKPYSTLYSHHCPTSPSKLRTTLFFIVLFTIPTFFLLRTTRTISLCSSVSYETWSWSGDLRQAEFAWNRLHFSKSVPPPVFLKIAVFSRKWPMNKTPGGMERHAQTLHIALAHRGHRIHVYTSPPDGGTGEAGGSDQNHMPRIHWHEGDPGKWKYRSAWELFDKENRREAFDVVHSESVALPHFLAQNVPNLAVTWHGIAFEAFQSTIYQELARGPNESVSATLKTETDGVIPKVLTEIRFFKRYGHHVAISDSCGEMLRDVYQIPNRRVHVIINGVNEDDFQVNAEVGLQFRSKIGIPQNASLVFGVAGRLVKDKGHPLLYEAFSQLIKSYPDVYLVVAGSGPWAGRYKELGRQVRVLGSMSPTELRAFYNSIDIFLNPTLRPQGLDLTMMEAMMIGKPIMASRFPSIKGSIVVKDEFGFMFTPNSESLVETMQAVVEEGAARLAQRGNACRKYAASMFTPYKVVSDSFRAIY